VELNGQQAEVFLAGFGIEMAEIVSIGGGKPRMARCRLRFDELQKLLCDLLSAMRDTLSR